MTDIEQLVDPSAPMTAGRFKAFLASTGWGKRPCECGGKWNIQIDAGAAISDDSPMYIGTIPDRQLANYLSVYILHCDTCGQVKFFNAYKVGEWDRKNG